MALSTREDFFNRFMESDARFPNMIYTARDRSPDNPATRSLITVIYSMEWPKHRGSLIPYKMLMESRDANNVIGNIFRSIDFFERHLAVEVKLFDVRSGCVRVRYSYADDVDEVALANGVARFRGVLDAYDASSISATYRGRSVRASE